MIPSDRSTGNGRSRIGHRLCLRPASILRERIKSIPRTRKEKCQNQCCRCQIQGSQMRRDATFCQFHIVIDRSSMPNALIGSRPGTICLTSLTAPCQRCQKMHGRRIVWAASAMNLLFRNNITPSDHWTQENSHASILE
jgi:hypothetical protein